MEQLRPGDLESRPGWRRRADELNFDGGLGKEACRRRRRQVERRQRGHVLRADVVAADAEERVIWPRWQIDLENQTNVGQYHRIKDFSVKRFDWSPQ